MALPGLEPVGYACKVTKSCGGQKTLLDLPNLPTGPPRCEENSTESSLIRPSLCSPSVDQLGGDTRRQDSMRSAGVLSDKQRGEAQGGRRAGKAERGLSLGLDRGFWAAFLAGADFPVRR